MMRAESYFHILLMAATAFNGVLGIKVLRNTLDIHVPKPVGGANLANGKDDVSVQDLTICLRFQLKTLGTYEGKATLVQIEDKRESDGVEPNFR